MTEAFVEFIGWNFETGKATLYRRFGDCNGCGDCCRRKIFVRSTTILPDPVTGRMFYEPGDDPQYGEEAMEPRFNNPERDSWQFDVTDEAQTCPALQNMMDGKGHCTVQREKPDQCSVFPTHPNDIKSLHNCSYHFEAMQAWEFSTEVADARHNQ